MCFYKTKDDDHKQHHYDFGLLDAHKTRTHSVKHFKLKNVMK